MQVPGTLTVKSRVLPIFSCSLATGSFVELEASDIFGVGGGRGEKNLAQESQVKIGSSMKKIRNGGLTGEDNPAAQSFFMTSRYLTVGILSKALGMPIGYGFNRYFDLPGSHESGKIVGRFCGGFIGEILMYLSSNEKTSPDFPQMVTRASVTTISGCIGDRAGTQLTRMIIKN